MSTLQPATQKRYGEALLFLKTEVDQRCIAFNKLTESEQDWWLAEWILEGYHGEQSKAVFAACLSALSKINPRCRYKVAWRVLDTWSVLEPVTQAPAAPAEMVYAMATLAVSLGRFSVGMAIMLCFCGLLRASEAIMLTIDNVIITSAHVVLVLGVTKRGIEEKVVLTHPTVISWCKWFSSVRTSKKSNDRWLSVSYTTFNKWVKLLPNLLGFDSLKLTTHSLRRSGASALLATGLPFSDVLLFGRWHTERAAREYIRRGEVAITKAKSQMDTTLWQRVLNWSAFAVTVWKVAPVCSNLSTVKVTSDVVGKLEGIFFH